MNRFESKGLPLAQQPPVRDSYKVTIGTILENIEEKVEDQIKEFNKAAVEYHKQNGFEPIRTLEESRQNIENILQFMKKQKIKEITGNRALMEEYTRKYMTFRGSGGYRRNKKSRKYKR